MAHTWRFHGGVSPQPELPVPFTVPFMPFTNGWGSCLGSAVVVAGLAVGDNGDDGTCGFCDTSGLGTVPFTCAVARDPPLPASSDGRGAVLPLVAGMGGDEAPLTKGEGVGSLP